MTEFLQDILNDQDNILTDLDSADSGLRQFFNRVRDCSLETLPQEDKIKLTFCLLKQL